MPPLMYLRLFLGADGVNEPEGLSVEVPYHCFEIGLVIFRGNFCFKACIFCIILCDSLERNCMYGSVPRHLDGFCFQLPQILESDSSLWPLGQLLSLLIHYKLYPPSNNLSTPLLIYPPFLSISFLLSCACSNLYITKQARMQQIDVLENVRRDLGEDEDLQLMIDHDEEHEQRQLKNKIIFSMQGLGGVKTIRRNDRLLEAYIKGQHCEESVKDLVKFIRMDPPANPKSRFILADYNIIETDLLQLLILQVQDKKLSFWIIALLALLTAKPSDDLNPQEKEKLGTSLREYKNSFVKKECFQILMVHIADFYKTPEAERLRAHLQLMEFIIVLVRNLVQIPNSEKFPHLHNHFLAAFVKEDMFNPLLYILQTDRSSLMSKIDIPLLEIFYHTFTCFEPSLLFNSTETSIFKKVLSLKMGQKPVPTRHSRFQPNFKVKTESGVTKLVHTLTPENPNNNKNLKKQPVRMTEIKKVTKIQSDKFSQNFMKIEIQSQGQLKTIGQVVLQMSRQFLQVQFEQLVKLVFDSIFKETPKVTDNNVIQYLLLCSWALQVVRAKYHKERAEAESDVEKDRVEFNLSWIVDVMQNAHFQLIYKILAREANREKKKEFKVNFFHAGLKLFSSYLDVIWEISNSMNMSERKNANVLMANIFRHDIAKILRIGFHNIAHEGVTSLVIKVSHKFFRLLSVYSEGKVLTIQTSKLIKKRPKRNREDHYNQQEDELNQFQSEDEKEDVKKSSALEEQRYQERKYNEKSEFAIIAEYAIITKYLSFLKNERFLTNSDELNEAIFYYIRQIKKLLSGEWLFFQAETLCVFQKIISNHEWGKKNGDKVKLLQSICGSFIKLLRKNPLALTESLFRFSSLSLKDHILKNYSDEYVESGMREENMFTDQ